MTTIHFEEFQASSAENSLFVAEKGYIETACANGLDLSVRVTSELFGGRDFLRISPSAVVAEFDNTTSRNLPFRVDKVKDIVSKHAPPKGNFRVILVLKEPSQVLPAGLAVSRLWPLYNKKSKVETRKVTIQFRLPVEMKIDIAELQNLGDSIRKAQLLMDTPCSELCTTDYVQEATKMVESLKNEFVSIEVIQGEQLKREFGGIYGVGKAASNPPALVVLKYNPVGATKTVALVGKGIVYDTGGLSLKSTAGMCSMKFDMGGSAAVFGAFQSLVKSRVQKNVFGLLCLAENAIGPNATRNDDILYMYSGKTVEVNNTDAEGRLVLGDGVAYASKILRPDIIIDIATLTGAQLITTGKKHAAVLTASEEVERAIIDAGKCTGDFVYPMLYCPQLLMSMFDSKVADMKNSVSDRSNAQSSCAGHFIESHLHSEYAGQWLHIDMAGPGDEKEQSTGYGVSLLHKFVLDY